MAKEEVVEEETVEATVIKNRRTVGSKAMDNITQPIIYQLLYSLLFKLNITSTNCTNQHDTNRKTILLLLPPS